MPIYSAEAVVLRKVDYGEADRILTLLTLERGKIPAIAKGVRKSKSRMAGQLDVFSHGKMLLAEGRSMDVVTQFQRITENSALGAELKRAAVASVVVEVADKIMEERHAADRGAGGFPHPGPRGAGLRPRGNPLRPLRRGAGGGRPDLLGSGRRGGLPGLRAPRWGWPAGQQPHCQGPAGAGLGRPRTIL